MGSLRGSKELPVEKQYPLYFDQLPLAILIVDRLGRIRYSNPAVQRLMGYSGDELQSMKLLRLTAPLKFSVYLSFFKQLLKNGKYRAEIIARTKSGELFPMAVEAVSFISGQYLAYCVDLSRQKSLEEALEKQSLFLTSVLDSLPYPFTVLDANTLEVRYGNEASGYQGSEGPVCALSHHSGERAKLIQKLKDTRQEQLMEQSFLDRDGLLHRMEVHAFPVVNEKGDVWQIIEYGIDITARKREEELLRKQEERLRLVVEGTGVAIWDWDRISGEMTVNERWAEMLGYRLDELSPLTFESWKKMVHPDDLKETQDLLEKHIRGEATIFETDYRMKHKNGGWVWIHDRGKVVEWTTDHQPLRMAGTHLDMTRRKEMEAEVARKLEQADLAIRGSENGIWDWDLKTGQVYFSPRWKEMLGYSDGEIANSLKAFEELIHPDDRIRVLQNLQDYLEGRVSKYSFEFRMKHKNGSDVWILSQGDARRDEKGIAYRVAGSHSDITYRKVSERQLEEARRRAEYLFQTSPNGLLLTRLSDGRIVEFNEGFLGLSEYSREEVEGKNIRELQLWGGSEERDTLSEELMAQGSFTNHELVLRTRSGRLMYGLMSAKIIILDGVPHMFSITQDITELKMAEEALRKNEALLKEMGAIAKIGAWNFDPETGQWNWTDEVAAMLEMESVPQNLVADYFLESSAKKIRKAVSEAVEYRKVMDIELEMLTSKDHHRWVRVIGKPVVENDRVARVYGSVQDITEQKEMQQQLLSTMEQFRVVSEKIAAMNARLEVAVAEKVKEIREKDHALLLQSRQAVMGEMLGNIAHQWRQPLNALGIILQNLNEAFEGGRLDSEYMERAQNKGMHLIMHMSETIDDFRNFFKPDRTPQEFDLAEAVRRTLSLVDSSFKNNGIEVMVNLVEGVKATGFPNEYGQVVLNILNNAKDALKESNVAAPWVSVLLKKEGKKRILKIGDNAGGVPEAIMEKIFDPYFTTKEEGTGIGLYMSRQIIERNMGGRISLENTDEGAEFTVELYQ